MSPRAFEVPAEVDFTPPESIHWLAEEEEDFAEEEILIEEEEDSSDGETLVEDSDSEEAEEQYAKRRIEEVEEFEEAINPEKRCLKLVEVLNERVLDGHVYFSARYAVPADPSVPSTFNVATLHEVVGTLALATFRRKERARFLEEPIQIFKVEFSSVGTVYNFNFFYINSVGQEVIEFMTELHYDFPAQVELKFFEALECQPFTYELIRFLFYFIRARTRNFLMDEEQFEANLKCKSHFEKLSYVSFLFDFMQRQ